MSQSDAIVVGGILVILGACYDAFALKLTIWLVRAWVRVYTLRLPSKLRAERRDELDSDLHEHVAALKADGYQPRAIAPQVLIRALMGIRSDLSWASAHRERSSRRASWVRRLWRALWSSDLKDRERVDLETAVRSVLEKLESDPRTVTVVRASPQDVVNAKARAIRDEQFLQEYGPLSGDLLGIEALRADFDREMDQEEMNQKAGEPE